MIGYVSKSLLTLAAATGFMVTAAAAQYPNKGIELVVPYAAGGGTDLVARVFADQAKKHLPKPVGVVNKTGGAGSIGLADIATGRPDGYKIGMGTVELTMLPHMGLAAFTADDFAPICRLNAEPSAITVKADAPWQTVEEFLAYAKANPGKVRIGNSGTGAIWHIAAAALESRLGTTFNHIPYDGANPAVTALLGGHIEAVTVSPPEVVSHVKGGTLRILAVMGEERANGFDDVPTLKEKGVDLQVATWRGIVVPKKTPANIVAVLGDVCAKTTAEPEFKEALAKMNLTWAYRDAAGYGETIKKDNAFFKETMTKLGIAK